MIFIKENTSKAVAKIFPSRNIIVLILPRKIEKAHLQSYEYVLGNIMPQPHYAKYVSRSALILITGNLRSTDEIQCTMTQGTSHTALLKTMILKSNTITSQFPE